MRRDDLDPAAFLDLAVAVIVVAAALFTVLVPGVVPSALRIAVGLLVVLFVPGYALLTALYPRTRPERAGSSREHDESDRDAGDSGDRDVGDSGDHDTGDSADRAVSDSDERGESATDRYAGPWTDDYGPVREVHSRSLTGVERFGLSVVASLVVVGSVTLASTLTPWGIAAEPIVVGIAGVTLVAVVAAALARLRLPPADRPRFVVGQGGGDPLAGVRPESTRARLLDLAVVLAVVLAVGLAAFQPFGTPGHDEFTEYQLLAEQDDGELAAANYPSEFVEGEGGESVFVRIHSHEAEATNYTVVVQLQEVENGATPADDGQVGDDESLQSTRTVELDRFTVAVDSGESRTIEHEPVPETTGELRLVYLFYEGDAPEMATRETADEALHIWVDVSEPDAAENSTEAAENGTDAEGNVADHDLPTFGMADRSNK